MREHWRGETQYSDQQGPSSIHKSLHPMETLNVEEKFPFPVTISRQDFLDLPEDQIDEFLYTNHRYTSIDSLISDLKNLLDHLNAELLDLVNNEYEDFIKLGQSIDGGLDLIADVQDGVELFKRDVGTVKHDITGSRELVQQALNQKQHLLQIKKKAKACLLLHHVVSNFEQILNSSLPDLDKIKELNTLYLSMEKLLSGFGLDDILFKKHLKTRVAAMKLEFKSYLDTCLLNYKENKNDNKSLVLDLLNTYRIIGHEEDCIRVLRK